MGPLSGKFSGRRRALNQDYAQALGPHQAKSTRKSAKSMQNETQKKNEADSGVQKRREPRG